MKEHFALRSVTWSTLVQHQQRTQKLLLSGFPKKLSHLLADPRAPVDSLIKNSKVKFSVDVSKSVAYRARRKAMKVVQGDQKEQYYRLRDYLQAVLDTNPGSRCVVTTFEDPENPAPTPRFKYMFYCLHASKQGFLNGCRPFIGKSTTAFCSKYLVDKFMVANLGMDAKSEAKRS